MVCPGGSQRAVNDTFDIRVAAIGQVTGVTVTPEVGSLAVTWDAVSGATGYGVQWKLGQEDYDAAT